MVRERNRNREPKGAQGQRKTTLRLFGLNVKKSKEGAMADATYNVIVPEKGLPIKAWTKGVQLEDQARQQLLNVAQLPFIFKWIAAMPDGQ